MADELELARKKKLEEMQKAQAQEEQVKSTLRTILDEEAYERMMNVKVASPELYMSAAQGCVSIYQRLGRRLGNKEVLMILRRMKGEDKETKITFERK
ncbi:Double-stranded DNA-binding domain protein [uncultured archaeon]|nr:Double-stranded DNA-binding domain protein [uncultured archaeon]